LVTSSFFKWSDGEISMKQPNKPQQPNQNPNKWQPNPQQPQPKQQPSPRNPQQQPDRGRR
jgi:hypothetical protein